MTFQAEREAVLAVARRTVAQGLTHGTSGNVSCRIPGGFLITPTGLAYETLTARDIVACDRAGQPAPGERSPSSEWRIHCDIYAARPDAGAVVHTHSPHATAIASLRRDLPAVHYMVAVAGGPDVRCAEYATFGTPELSASALRALEGRAACLLANHGVVAIGRDLSRALRVAEEVERVAEIYWLALAAGTPVVLDAAEMARVAERFGTYGRQAGAGEPRP